MVAEGILSSSQDCICIKVIKNGNGNGFTAPGGVVGGCSLFLRMCGRFRGVGGRLGNANSLSYLVVRLRVEVLFFYFPM